MKYLFFGIILLTSLISKAQEEAPSDTIPFEIRKQAYIYMLAQKYNDPAVTRMALYNLIAMNPGSPALLDSLAFHYLNYQQYASAALSAQDAMSLNPNDMYATEIAAVAFENLGVRQRAINNYEKLYLVNNDLGTLYKIAFLQYEVKNSEEALTNADIIINSSKADNLKLIFPVGQNGSQEISLKACAVRLKGMVEQDRGNVSLAKELYQKTLEMEPSFEVVQQQLAEMDK
mgnify:CR=1 FL=1